MVFRLDFYVGERDLFGIGFSDNVVFRKQYYIRAMLQSPVRMYLHTNEAFADEKFDLASVEPLTRTDRGWTFEVGGTGFSGTFQIEVDEVPEEGDSRPLRDVALAPVVPAVPV